MASVTFTVAVASSAIGLITSSLLAHWLGPEKFGVYSFIMALTGLAAVVAGLGFSTIILRYTAASRVNGHWETVKGLLIYSSSLTLLASIGAGVVLWLVGLRLGNFRHIRGFHGDLLLAIILMVLGIQSGLLTNLLQGLNKIIASIVPASLIVPAILIMTVTVLRLYTGVFTVSTILRCQLALTFGLVLGQTIQVLRALPREFFHAVTEVHALKWSLNAFPFLLNSMMITINLRTDIFMLGLIKGPEYAGIYNAASKGALLLVVPLGALVTASRPTIASLYAQGDFTGLQALMTMTSRLATAVSIFGCLILVLFGKSLLAMLFGQAFSVGASALAILSGARVVNAATGSLAPFLSMTNRPKLLGIGLSIEAILNVGFNYILIPLMGMNGSALATGGSMALSNVALSMWVYKRSGYDVSLLGRHTHYSKTKEVTINAQG